MTPDFEYLLRLEPLSLVSHSVRGLFVFCLPVGAVLWAFWEWLVRPVGRDLFALTPSPVSDALSSARDSSARASGPGGTRTGAWLGVVVALLLGSASHVGWDAFTHRYAWGGENVPLLRETAFTVGGTAVPWYNALQHASTLLGGMVVLGWLWGEVTRGGGRAGGPLGAPPPAALAGVRRGGAGRGGMERPAPRADGEPAPTSARGGPAGGGRDDRPRRSFGGALGAAPDGALSSHRPDGDSPCVTVSCNVSRS